MPGVRIPSYGIIIIRENWTPLPFFLAYNKWHSTEHVDFGGPRLFPSVCFPQNYSDNQSLTHFNWKHIVYTVELSIIKKKKKFLFELSINDLL